MVKMGQFVTLIILFFVATAPLQAIAQIQIASASVRVGYIALFFCLPCFLVICKKYWKSSFFRASPALLYLLYLCVQVLFLTPCWRSLGFIGWSFLNIVFFVVAFFKKEKRLLMWYECANLINASVIIFMHLYNKLFPLKPIFGDISFFPLGDGTYVYRSFGFYLEPSFVAVGVAPLLLWLILKNKRKKIDYFKICVLTLALGLTYSRTSLLSILVVGFLVVFLPFVMGKWKIVCVLFVSLLFTFVSEPKFFLEKTQTPEIKTETPIIFAGSKRERLTSLSRAWETFLEHPIFGVGFGNSKKFLQEKYSYTIHVEGVHNLFLEILLEQGLVGFIFFLGIIIFIVKQSSIRSSLPFLFLLFVPLQFAQTMNIPIIWIFAANSMIETRLIGTKDDEENLDFFSCDTKNKKSSLVDLGFNR